MGEYNEEVEYDDFRDNTEENSAVEFKGKEEEAEYFKEEDRVSRSRVDNIFANLALDTETGNTETGNTETGNTETGNHPLLISETDPALTTTPPHTDPPDWSWLSLSPQCSPTCPLVSAFVCFPVFLFPVLFLPVCQKYILQVTAFQGNILATSCLVKLLLDLCLVFRLKPLLYC